MCVAQLNLIILTTVLITGWKNEVQACTTNTFNKTKMLVYYSANNFVYETDNEINYLHTDMKTMTVSGCVSPTTTQLIDRKHIGTVQQVMINDQTIPVLQKDAITSLSTIWLIGLQRNKITKIKKGAFSNLNQLEMLNLNENEIKSMEDNILINVPHLRSLYLHDNNLKTFEQEWLGNLPQLYVLNLAYNDIEDIYRAAFKNLASLRLLDISHNKILRIHEKAFDGLNSLNMLDLSYNRINQIQDDLFTLTASLKVLNLYNNNITYVSDEALESLSHLEDLVLLLNPLPCVCYRKICEWAVKQGVDMLNTFLMCHTEDPTNIPVCVTTNSTECVENTEEDLFSILHSNTEDYKCVAQSVVIKVM